MQRGSKIAVVEYLRGFAALAVAWFHCTNQYAPGPVRMSGSCGWLGIAVFFVISGFVLPYSIWQREGVHYGVAQASRFAWRRIVRIEPPYLISAAMTVGLWYLSAMAPGFRGAAPDATWGQLAAHMRFMHTEAGRLALSLGALASAVLFAWLFWRFVERRFVELAHRGKRLRAEAIAA